MTANPVSSAQLQQRLATLDSYELPTSLSRPRGSSARLASMGTPIRTPDAAVVANGVVAFVSGMTEQNKADVRNTYLYASLVATKAFPRDVDGAQWYERFTEVLGAVGWIFVGKKYSQHRSHDVGATMDQIGLQMLASAVASASIPGAAGPALLKVANTAMEKLTSGANTKPLSLFNNKAAKSDNGQFTLGSCIESADGEVIMALGAVHSRSRVNNGNVLLLNWSYGSSQVHTGSAQLVLNADMYRYVRSAIQQRLGQHIEAAIELYEI